MSDEGGERIYTYMVRCVWGKKIKIIIIPAMFSGEAEDIASDIVRMGER